MHITPYIYWVNALLSHLIYDSSITYYSPLDAIWLTYSLTNVPLWLTHLLWFINAVHYTHTPLWLTRPLCDSPSTPYDSPTTEARESIEAALRVIFGCETCHLSLLYLLRYANSAGGFGPLISEKTMYGAQEMKVKVGQLGSIVT